jgi:hypothetical protein
MLLNVRLRRMPRVWRVAVLGTMAALPATVVINRLPNSEVTVGGGVMLVGATIAGAVAATRSVAPAAAGLRAGFLGGVTAVFVFLLTEGRTVTWSLDTVVFFLVAVVMLLCVSPVVGLVSGRIGGWMANAVAGFAVDRAR